METEYDHKGGQVFRFLYPGEDFHRKIEIEYSEVIVVAMCHYFLVTKSIEVSHNYVNLFVRDMRDVNVEYNTF